MEEQIANHSEQVEQIETQTETPQQQEVESTPQENYFKVKYNKEEVQIPYDQAPDYIQKGMNYDKVQQKAETYQQQLDRAARLAGYQSHDELIQALDELEQQQQRQQYEDAGLNPDVLNQFLEKHPDIQYARQLKAKEEQDAKHAREWGELTQEFPDLKLEDVPDAVWSMYEQGKPLLDAYLRHNYKNLGQQKEQEAIKKLQQNQSTSPGALGQEGSEHKTSYSQLSASEKAKLRERVLRGEATSIF